MGDRFRSATFDDLPSHLILEILTSGARLSGVDLACLELTNSTFRATNLVDFAAFQLSGSHPVYVSLSNRAQEELLARCNGNWKKVLRFLQSVYQSSDIVETSSGNMQIRSGRYHTFLIKDSSVYSCGSSVCGVLGHGPEMTRCSFTPIKFPYPAQVTHVSASHNHAAFVTNLGEVFTCGDNSSFCCGHGDTNRTIYKPRLVEALKDVPCKQVAAGVSFTVFLTTQGQVYTCGTSGQGQLGHGDTLDRPTPKLVEPFGTTIGPVIQIAAGPSYTLAVTNDGTVYSFGSGSNFCLGHGEQHNELRPRVIQSFRRKGIHIVRVSAGDEHVVALDSNGFVYTWGKGYCGALGHGDEVDRIIPELLSCLKNHLAVQVCASKRKTFVLLDNGSLYGFGWMAFGSLGFPDRGKSDKVLKPSMLYSLKDHHICQVSTGLYHSVVVTNQGRIFGFGDNERVQLAHDELRDCLHPTEIFVEEASEDGGFCL